MSKLVERISLALENTELLKSNLNKEILEMEGMSGYKTRHFYNNLCSFSDTRYLEIGSWKGSSLCSAMYKNTISCTAIDNWSLWEGPKNEFLKNYETYKGNNNAKFIENDCWNVDINKLDKVNIYMYDGHHSESSHYKALNYFLPILDTEFIYLVDDWNWESVREGTDNSIKDNNLNIIYKKEIFTEKDPGRKGALTEWHNGICIFVLKK